MFNIPYTTVETKTEQRNKHNQATANECTALC